MHLTIDRTALTDVTAWAASTLHASSLPPGSRVAVLAGLLLEAGPNRLTVSAFDYKVSAHTAAHAVVHEPGRVLVPGRLLAEIAGALPDHRVRITTGPERLHLTCGPAEFTLPLLTIADYPALPVPPPPSGDTRASAFTEAVRVVAVAASRGSSLPALRGVHLVAAPGLLRVTAGDGCRVAVREVPWAGDPVESLVHASTLADATKGLGARGSISIGSDQGLASFSAVGRHSTARLLALTYPSSDHLWPTAAAGETFADAAALSRAAHNVGAVHGYSPKPIELTVGPDGITVRAERPGTASAEEHLDGNHNGASLTTYLNPRHLIDGIATVASDTVRIAFTTPTCPVVITPEDTATSTARYLLVPLRLQRPT